jgi:PAS domain S-box-containing protein
MSVWKEFLNKFTLTLSGYWTTLSNLGISYCKTEEEKRNIILANRINGITIILLFINIIVPYFLLKNFITLNTLLAFLAVLLNIGFSKKGFHKTSKLSLCILPLFFLLSYNIIFKYVPSRQFLWYTYTVICFSIVPHLVFSFKTEKYAYMLSVLYYVLLLMFSEKILMFNTKDTYGIVPLIKHDFLILKFVHLSLFLFLNLIILYYVHLAKRYESNLVKNALLIKRQTEELTLANKELNSTIGNLNITNRELEQYQHNLEEMVTTRTIALKESESRLISVSHNLKAGMIFQVIYKDGIKRFSFLSNSVRQLHNITPEEGMADPMLIYEKIHEDDIESLLKAEIESARTLSNFKAEVRIKEPSGTYRWSSFISTPRKLDDGSLCWDGIEFIITENKLAEDALRISEERYRQLIQSSNDWIWEVNQDGVYTFVSQHIFDILGYAPEEIIGKSPFDFMPPEEAKRVGDIFVSYAAGRKPFRQLENVNRHKDGRLIIMETNGVPTFNNGVFSGYRGTDRDITERKKAEEALKLSEEKFSKAFRSSPIAISISRIDNGCFIDCNEALSESIEYSHDELIANSSIALGIWENAEKRKQIIAELMLKGSIKNKEINFRTKHKNFITVLFSCEIINYAGENCILSVFEDITQRKKIEEALRESEAHYRTFIENSPDIIARFDKDCRYVFINEAVKKISKMRPEEFIGKNIDMVGFSKELAEKRKEMIKQVFETMQTLELETEFKTKNGNQIYDWRIFPEFDAKGRVISVISINRDITEKKETERRILHAIIEAEEGERNYFAREIHDGLGPLLSTIRLYLQWLNKPDLKASKDELLRKADLVIEDAILSAKEISHKLSPQILINFGLTPAIENFISKISDTTSTVIHFESEVQTRLNNDIEITLYRVITECLNNSVKYAKAGNISIIIKYGQNNISMFYTDDGIGFDVSEQSAKGKGIGLSNIQNRVATLGGTFSIHSNRNKGVNIEVQINM